MGFQDVAFCPNKLRLTPYFSQIVVEVKVLELKQVSNM